TLIGVAIGVSAGMAMAIPFMHLLENKIDMQFIREIQPVAWIVAAAMEIVFSIVIHAIVFRKVKHLNFRDIQ
ncbi:MAG: hypothetical protein J6D18_00215, partial [Erysipelotrichaceae bacterium]|nr:hypothetical protein [Erysipelotrichaceae bacterium]